MTLEEIALLREAQALFGNSTPSRKRFDAIVDARRAAESQSPVERLVALDGWHCDPECPHLKPGGDPENVLGKCAVTGDDLDWYDYFIAACAAS